MKTNIGTIDKVIRIALAIVFAVLYFTGTVSGTMGIILLVLGGVFLLTSRWAPVRSTAWWASVPVR